MGWLKLNIYAKLLSLFLLLSLLPLIILGWVSYRNAQQSLKQTIGYELEELARLTMEMVDRQLDDYLQDIQVWSELEVIQDVLTDDVDGRINASLINFKKSNPSYQQLSCLNQRGEIVAASEPRLMGEVKAKTEWFKQTLAGQTYMSKLTMLENGKPVINLAAPIWAIGNRKRVIGVLYATFDWEYIYPRLESIRIEKTVKRQLKGAHIMIIDRAGLVIFAPQWERRALDDILKPALFPEGIPGADSQSQSGYTIQLDEHNQLSLLGYAHSTSHGNYPGTDWTTLALQNVEQAFAPVFRLRSLMSISLVILALISILTAHLFAKQLTIPIKSLTQAARHIARSTKGTGAGFSERIQVKTTDEIGKLADAFNFMSSELSLAKGELEEKNQKLKDYAHNLEDKVKQRTVELERAAEEIRESDEKFRKITTSAQDAILMMDNDGNISNWNEAAEKIFGYSSEEVLGKELHNFLAPKRFYQTHIAAFGKFKITGQGLVVGKTLELTAVKKDGTEFPIELSLSAVKLKGKWNAIGIVRDIIERKRKEEEIKRNAEMLQQANQELKNTQAQLVQSAKLASIGQLAAGVSHELNNPLGGILGYSQFILEMAKKAGLENLTP